MNECEASARSRALSLSLSPSLSSLSLSFSPSFFGGEASARKLSLLEFSPSFAVWGGEASDCEGRKPRCLLKAPRPRRARARTRTQQSTVFFVCHFFVLLQHSLPAAIWTLIRQPQLLALATTLKMRLLSLLLSAHRLFLITIFFKLCPPPPPHRGQ
jgi:hypothetical protein